MATPSTPSRFGVTRAMVATGSQIVLILALALQIYFVATTGRSLPATSLEVFVAANLVVTAIVARLDR